ncbi:putative phage cell wall peptidase, NlpC/P60 family [Parvibaculum lavamentivorans DS-1]|uniref:Putative phage cell wall peptidase, NlpC/P60 family n=1 Tax=Parvibaculum lavamentivorans (strain DS-1 / DSM 13023 / NCIMB 13966) TaxID=402881 RepID=A7HRK8_PARL1|nr:NlpC/P60 family protein [Parvibaculum lavamentivorans]ABS62541.1 putative phage cell wall peptidase, NlpC/P60 family [Parvibaculum lavamentivorans DS-1]
MTTREEIVAAARGWIGTPYRHQASVKGAGTDCLGLVRGVWREIFGTEPEAPPAYTPDWAETPGGAGGETMAEAAGRHMTAIACGDVEAGDIMLFRMRAHGPAKHVAILSGGNRMIHAWSGRAVVETTLGRWWRARAAYAYRFPGLEG